jgi:hypothetical protein
MESSSSTWRSISIMAASCGFSPGLTTGSLYTTPGLWIRIDLMRIRIQNFFLLRIRIRIQF